MKAPGPTASKPPRQPPTLRVAGVVAWGVRLVGDFRYWPCLVPGLGRRLAMVGRSEAPVDVIVDYADVLHERVNARGADPEDERCAGWDFS
jgi:hypothetical protein